MSGSMAARRLLDDEHDRVSVLLQYKGTLLEEAKRTLNDQTTIAASRQNGCLYSL